MYIKGYRRQFIAFVIFRAIICMTQLFIVKRFQMGFFPPNLRLWKKLSLRYFVHHAKAENCQQIEGKKKLI